MNWYKYILTILLLSFKISLFAVSFSYANGIPQEVIDFSKNKIIEGMGIYNLDYDFDQVVTIAIIDTGVSVQEDLSEKYLMPGYSVVDTNDDVPDYYGHGTKVTGVMINILDAISPELYKYIEILPIKVSNTYNFNEAELVNAIYYAISQNVSVISISNGQYSYSTPLHKAIKYAESRGILIVASAGNDKKVVKYPAAFSTVLACGSVDSNYNTVSNYGYELDLVTYDFAITYDLEGNIDLVNGSSFAVPKVSAIAAVLMLLEPNYTNKEIRSLLKYSTQDLNENGWDSLTGYGFLKFDLALNNIREPLNKILVNSKHSKFIQLNKENIIDISQVKRFYFSTHNAGYLSLYIDTMLSNYEHLDFKIYLCENNKLVNEKTIKQADEVYLEHSGEYVLEILNNKNNYYETPQYIAVTPFLVEANGIIKNEITELKQGSDIFEAYIISYEQIDKYRIALEKDQKLKITVNPESVRFDPNIILTEGVNKIEIDKFGSGMAETLEFISNKRQEYIIYVADSNSVGLGKYQLSYWVESNN